MNFLDRIQEKAGWKAWKGNRRRKHDILMGWSPGAKAEPHQNITATVAVCLSMHLHESQVFFLHMIEEIYDRNASLSIYQKFFIYLYVWPAIVPYTVGYIIVVTGSKLQ